MLNNSYYSYFFVEKHPTFSYFSVEKAPTFFLLFGEWLLEGLQLSGSLLPTHLQIWPKILGFEKHLDNENKIKITTVN